MKVILFPLLGCFCIASLACRKSADTEVEHREISEEESDKAIKKAFGERGPGEVVAVPDGVEKFFTVLGRASRSEGAIDTERFLTISGMMASLESTGVLDSLSKAEKKDFVAGFRQGIANLGATFRQMAFDRHRIQLVEQIAEKEVLVYVRLYDNDLGAVHEMRWWLVETGEGWRAYDYEDLSIGLRSVKLMGTLLSQGMLKGEPAWVAEFLAVAKAMRELDYADPESVQAMKEPLQNLRKHEIPKDLQVFASVMMVAVLQGEGDAEGSLAELDAARDGGYSGPLADFQRGDCLKLLERHEEALASYQKYIDRFGSASDIMERTADANLALGRLEEAKADAKAGLADNPAALGCLISLAAASEPAEISGGDFAGYFSKIPGTEEAYDIAMNFLLEEGYSEQAGAVFEIFVKEFPESDVIELYQEEFAGEE